MSTVPEEETKDSVEKNDEVKNEEEAAEAQSAPSNVASAPVETAELEEQKSKTSLDEKEIKQARRKIALEALYDAEDMPSIFNLLELVKELHEGFQMHPTAIDLVQKATTASEYLMFKSVVERLTRPRSFGGLAWAETKAKQIADKLFETMGSECCAVDVSENKLVKKGGQEMTDARRILPHLIAVGEEINDKKEELRSKVLEAPESELIKVTAELAKDKKKVVVTRIKTSAPPTPSSVAVSPAKAPRSKKRKPEIPLAEDLGDGKRSMRARKKVDYGPLMHS